MPIFRFHKGGLKESLETCFIVHSEEELLLSINDHYQNTTVLKIKIKPYGGLDTRIGWFTQMVLGLLPGENEYSPIGFLSEPFDQRIQLKSFQPLLEEGKYACKKS